MNIFQEKFMNGTYHHGKRSQWDHVLKNKQKINYKRDKKILGAN